MGTDRRGGERRSSGEVGGPATRVYRTTPAVVLGVGLILAAVVLGGTALATQAARGQGLLGTLAVVVLLGTAAWVLMLRPCVRLGPDGVVLRNLLTDVTVPWQALQEVGHQWALELTDTAGSRHSAWAVPAKRELRPRTRKDDFAEATTRAKSREGVHAKNVAGDVESRWQEWRRAGGRKRDGMPARRRWVPEAIAPLVLAGVLVLLALLL